MIKTYKHAFLFFLFSLSFFLYGCCSNKASNTEKIRLLEANLNELRKENEKLKTDISWGKADLARMTIERNDLREENQLIKKENELMKKDIDWAKTNKISLPSTRPNYSEKIGGRFHEVFEEVPTPKDNRDTPAEVH